MAIEYSQLRNIVLEHLRCHPKGDINLVGGDFAKAKAQTLGLDYTEDDRERVLDLFHELYREGIIVSGSGPNSAQGMLWPYYRLTEYGRQVLEATEYVPHDPEGYLAQIKQDVPKIDETITRYLEEALGCFKANHFLAAAVMMGCAAEKAMLLLIEVFGNALADSDEQAKYKGVVEKHWMISRKYEQLWKRLQQKLGRLPAELSDDLHVILERAFDLIKTTRNAAGHPTGKIIDRNTVRANFILFPTYCRRIYSLIEWLQKTSI